MKRQWSIALPAVLLAGAGCASIVDAGAAAVRGIDDATFRATEAPPAHLAGEYQLVAVAGAPLPATEAGGGGETCESGEPVLNATLSAGSLEIGDDGEVILRSSMEFMCGDPGRPTAESSSVTEVGYFREFDPASGQFTVRMRGMRFVDLVLDGDAFVWEEVGMRWERARALAHQDDPPITATGSVVGQNGCASHPELDDLPPIAAQDTAGIGARIDASFPGWRLSTEAEMGCRTVSGGTWTSPRALYGRHWQSGEAWWVWRGDFNGDGREDQLAVLSKVADPSEDKLVVLHATGSGQSITSLGGSLVAGKMEAGQETGGCRENPTTGELIRETFRLPHDAFWIGNNDNWAEGYLWDDGAYRPIHEVTGLGACH